MGWCSGTRVFDAVAECLLSDNKPDVKSVLLFLIKELEDMDWDCQGESDYYNHPMVREIMKELHPRWFE